MARIHPSEPIPFGYNVGSVAGDLIMGASTDLFLISERFRATLDGEFSGWSSYPVIATTRRQVPVMGYTGLSITGRAGPPLWEYSEPFVTRYVPTGPPVPSVRGLFFDADTWDGTDLFLLGDTGFIVATARLYHALKAAKLRNVRYERLADFDISLSALKPEHRATAGRLGALRHSARQEPG